jgi:phytoene synthase
MDNSLLFDGIKAKSFHEIRKGLMNADTLYCKTQVETYDHDRYILTMAADAGARPHLWALYAFNHEIAKTREVVRDVNAGLIRLAWWREALAAPQPPAHDVARALDAAIKTYHLPSELFSRLLDARGIDLDGHIPPSLDALIDYADATNTPLLELSAHMTGGNKNLKNLGIAYGITGIIRTLPWHARQNRCLLPMPMLHDIGLMPEQFHYLKSSPALSKAVQTLVNIAREYLNGFEAETRFFKMQKRMCAFYLDRIEKAGGDPFDPRVYAPVPFLGIRLLF